MICLRCGYCCQKFLNVVVHPDYVKEDLDLSTLPDEGFLALAGIPCPHLKKDGFQNYTCTVHHYEWYKETPCYAFTQIEHGDTVCRLGAYHKNGPVVNDNRGVSWEGI